MAGITWRQRVAVAAAGATAMLALTACGDNATPTTNPTPTNGGQLGGAPTESATPTAPATPTSTATNGGGNGGGGTGSPTYPKAAKDYAVAFMKAWSFKDYNRVGQLGVSSMVQQAKDSNNGNGAPNSGWVMYSCSSVQSDNTVGCTVRNTHGDDARVTMNALQLGFPTAVTMVLLERTEYPSTPADYIAALLNAKDQDNRQRIDRLSNSTVRSKLTCALSGTYATVEPIDGTYSKVTVQATPTSPVTYEFKMLTNPGGKAYAVKQVLSAAC